MDKKLNKNTEVKGEHKRASKVIFILGVILVACVVFALISSLVLLLFSVGEIEVVGDSRYNYSDIIDASGITKGQRLYYLNENKAENETVKKISEKELKDLVCIIRLDNAVLLVQKK